MEVRRDVPRHAIDADALCDPHDRRDEKRIFLDTDLLAPDKPRLHLLGKHRSGAEPSNELKARFTNMFGATLIRRDSGHNVTIPSGNGAASVHIR